MGKSKGPKIIISGAPASGKGTQCELLKSNLGVVHLSTGDMLRSAVEEGTALGKAAKEYMDKGLLVPDDVMIGMVGERLAGSDCKEQGWLLDGFPRTKKQAVALKEAGVVADKFVVLNVPDEVLIERVIGRRIDPETGAIYHLKYSPPPQEAAARCVQRSDDTEEKARVRLRGYHANIDAVKAVFKDILYELDGTTGKDVVFKSIFKALTKPVFKKIPEREEEKELEKGQKSEDSQFYQMLRKRKEELESGTAQKKDLLEKSLQESAFDQSVYKELKKRRDFGLEQELYSAVRERGGDVSKMFDGNYIDPLTGKTVLTSVLPSSTLTPNEVIMNVLNALRDNDNPYENHGVEVFARFSSPVSYAFDQSIDAVADFLTSSEYEILAEWDSVTQLKPLDLSTDKEKAFQLLKLTNREERRSETIKVSLSKHFDCWLIDSMIVKI